MQRRFRLRRPADFKQLRQHGRRWNHPLATLIVYKTDQPISRFAFSASKRVGNAVVRNRARRLMREAVRRHTTTLRPGRDCLFIARQATAQAALMEVEEAVLQLLHQADVIELQSEE